MKKRSVIVTGVFVLSLMFAVSAFAGTAIDRVLKKGALAIGTTGTQPPMSATSKKGDLFGMDIDLSRAMAEALGVELKLVSMPFTELLPALKAGRVDMVLSGMTMTPERNKKVAFVGPYMVTGKGVLAVAERFVSIRRATGLDSPEVTVAALKGSTSQKFAETAMPKTNLVLFDTYAAAVELLLNNKVDVIVADFQVCALKAYKHRGKGLIAGEAPLSFEPLGIAMPVDTLMINWVQNFLNHLQGTGELEKLADKWLNIGSWFDELP